MQDEQHKPPDAMQHWQAAHSPELDLLLLCARWPQRDEDRSLIRERSRAPLDWRLFLHLARHHRIQPLVYSALRAGAADTASPECDTALAELQQATVSSAHEALRTLAELRRLVQKLRTANISVRVLKGLPLAQCIYGDLSLRPAGDIDLLIDAPSVLQADHVLRGSGYHPQPPVDQFSPSRLAFYCAHWKDLTYHNPATAFEVDLHWRCFRNPSMPGADLCATGRQESVMFGGFQVDTLPRTEALLYLCVHGALDCWLYLKSLVDVGAQVRTMTEPELDSLATLAAGYGILPELSATLILVRRYLSMDHWSAHLLTERDPIAKHILRYSDRILVHGSFLATRESIPIATTLAFEFGLRPSFRYRLELLTRILFRYRMWQTFPLPDWLFWAYPLLSPLEWLVHRTRRRAARPPSGATLTI